MTKHQIASLSLKLLGIYSIIEAIPLLKELSQVFAWRGSKLEMEGGFPNSDILLLGIMLSVGLLLVIGLCLIIFSKALASKMVTSQELEDPTAELTAKDIQSIAFSVVGLVLIVFAVPHLVNIAMNLQALKNVGVDSAKHNIAIGTWAYSIGIAVQFIIGILLFLGGSGLSSIWHSIQKIRPMKNID